MWGHKSPKILSLFINGLAEIGPLSCAGAWNGPVFRRERALRANFENFLPYFVAEGLKKSQHMGGQNLRPPERKIDESLDGSLPI